MKVFSNNILNIVLPYTVVDSKESPRIGPLSGHLQFAANVIFPAHVRIRETTQRIKTLRAL